MEVVLQLDPLLPPRARAWVGELPNLPTEPSQVVQKVIEVRHPPRRSRSIAAIEVLIPCGGRFIYGLLGGEFTPNDSQPLVVQVACSETGQTITDWSLARRLDAVISGIPPWAAEEILNAALENAESQALGPGCLRYSLGAHGVLGSSRSVFRGLAGVVVSLICLDNPLSEAELSSILKRHSL